MNYDRGVMKLEVKQAMRRTQTHPMLVTLLYLVIVGVGSGLISGLTSSLNSLLPSGILAGNLSLEDLLYGIMTYGEDYLETYFESMLYSSPQFFVQLMIRAMLISLVTGILASAWNGLMSVGYAGYCLDMSRSMDPPLERIFGGFSRAGNVILAYILVTVFTFLWNLLFGFAYGIVLGILTFLGTAVPALWVMVILLALAATAGYGVGIAWAVFRYAMVPYAIIDSWNDLSAMDAIRASKALMQGRKGRYFVLQLSFINWMLPSIIGILVFVGFLTAGIIVAAIDEGSGLMMIFGSTIFVGIAMLVQAIISLWLTPYRTSCEARFYDYARNSGQPIQSFGSQPPYGGQPPYGSQPPYGGQSPYGGQPGPYNNDPYGYTPPSQGSFGGYTQIGQPPQYGTGTYTQPEAPNDDDTPQRPSGPSYPQY